MAVAWEWKSWERKINEASLFEEKQNRWLLDIRLLGKSREKAIRRLKLSDSMTEQILPIGIDSTLDHVQSEADRIDALFTVPTGPMGFQQVNYHTIDEERQRYSLTLLTSTIAEPFETQRTSGISVTDDRHLHAQNTGKGSILSDLNTGEARNDVKTNRLPARFSLPEIDSSSQHEKNPSTLSVRSALRFASKEAVLVSEW